VPKQASGGYGGDRCCANHGTPNPNSLRRGGSFDNANIAPGGGRRSAGRHSAPPRNSLHLTLFIRKRRERAVSGEALSNAAPASPSPDR
jgi:hypothetical protein